MSFADELRQEGNKKKQYGYADGCFQIDWIDYLKKCAKKGERHLQGYLGVNTWGNPIYKFAPYTGNGSRGITVIKSPMKFERRFPGDENGLFTLEQALEAKRICKGDPFSDREDGDIFDVSCSLTVFISFSMTDEVDMAKEIQAEIMKCNDGSFNKYSAEVVKVKRPYHLRQYGRVIQARKKGFLSETPEMIEYGWREDSSDPQMYAIYVDIAW